MPWGLEMLALITSVIGFLFATSMMPVVDAFDPRGVNMSNAMQWPTQSHMDALRTLTAPGVWTLKPSSLARLPSPLLRCALKRMCPQMRSNSNKLSSVWHCASKRKGTRLQHANMGMGCSAGKPAHPRYLDTIHPYRAAVSPRSPPCVASHRQNT